MDPNIVEPLPDDDGTRGQRVEIDEFIADNEMTNLFLIALYNLERSTLDKDANNQTIWTNFYGIAGIHGYPAEKWNGVSKDNPSGWTSYCHHSMITFPTWHRPYMYLFERAVYIEMMRVAGLYSEPHKSAATAAANRFRLPYWDFIMPRHSLEDGAPSSTVFGVPEIFQRTEVTVRLPDKDHGFHWDTIENPLFQFDFPTDDELKKAVRVPLNIPAKLYSTTHTTRAPDNTGETDLKTFNGTVQSQAAILATRLWQLLTPGPDPKYTGVKVNQARDWNVFSNTRSTNGLVNIDGQNYSSPSIESWHNAIHNLVGKGPGTKAGMMGNPSWAGFDPIFFMHHNNIDRFLSLYQALFVGKYILEPGLSQDLTPFFKTSSKNEFIKSNHPIVDNYWGPGFAVPGDKPPKDTSDFAKVQQAVETYLTDTYYWATVNGDPSKSLPTWPKTKNIENCWALNPVPSEDPPQQVATMQITALEINKPGADIVKRETPILKLAGAANGEAADAGAGPAQDTPVEVSDVLTKIQAIDSDLPTGVFGTAQPDHQTTWNAEVKVREYAFDGSFNTHIFLGKVDPNNPQIYMLRDNEVGFAAVFARSSDDIESCSNCVANRDNDIYMHDVIPLTTALYKYLDAAPGSNDLIQDGQHQTIRDLSPESVIPFLKEQLSWRMVSLTGEEFTGQEQAAGLEIKVSSRAFISPTDAYPMGRYSFETVYPEITNNKPGGFGYVY